MRSEVDPEIEVDPEMRAVKKVLELAVWEVFRDAGRHRSEVPLL